jgi:SMC interacting uncharacterized protein involved in chromosome segregation
MTTLPTPESPLSSHQEFVSLRDYMEMRFVEFEKRFFQTAETLDRRLEGMNEFRNALSDQATRMATRLELEAKVESIEKELKSLNTSRDVLESKASQSSVNIAQFLGVIAIVLSLVGIILRFFGL